MARLPDDQMVADGRFARAGDEKQGTGYLGLR